MMATNKQLVIAKRQRTGPPNTIKKRVILQDCPDPTTPGTSARLQLESPQRVLPSQQSFSLSPPRSFTVTDRDSLNDARTNVASLKDKGSYRGGGSWPFGDRYRWESAWYVVYYDYSEQKGRAFSYYWPQAMSDSESPAMRSCIWYLRP